jgi:hypothetical protein
MSRHGKPAFVVFSARDGMEYYVLVIWSDGEEDRLSRFQSREDAERWIERESEAWIRLRAGKPPT